MNSIDKFLLWLTMLIAPVYTKMGVHLPHLKTILITKLVIDNRTVSGFYNRYSKKEGTLSDATAITMFLSLIIGASLLVFFLFSDDITRLTFYFLTFMFMMGMSIIVNFTTILFDAKDNYILLTKPVNPATIIVSRLLHTLINIAKIAIPMLLPAMVAIGISRGLWASMIFLPISALVVIFTVFLVNIFYLLLLKIASPAKFNSLISGFQIFFPILLFVLYQLGSGLFRSSALNNFILADQIYLWLIPSYWFAGTWKLLNSFSFDPKHLISALLSIGMTLLSLWLIVKYLAPAFQRKLYLISVSEGGNTITGIDKNPKNNFSFISILARWLTWNKAEHGAFQFTLKMMARTRDFKLAVYPNVAQFAFMLILPLSHSVYKFVCSGISITPDNLKLEFVISFYISSFLFFIVLNHIPYSDRFRSAWIFFTIPLEKPGNIFIGTIKACLLKFFAPFIIFISIISLLLVGPGIIPNIIFGLCNTLLFSAIISLFILKEFPFSVSRPNQDQTDTVILMIFYTIAVLAIGALPHYILFNFPKVMLLLSIFTLTAAILIYRSIAKLGWSDLKQDRMLEETQQHN
jgi:ABC-2 type transport system permease protein